MIDICYGVNYKWHECHLPKDLNTTINACIQLSGTYAIYFIIKLLGMSIVTNGQKSICGIYVYNSTELQK